MLGSMPRFNKTLIPTAKINNVGNNFKVFFAFCKFKRLVPLSTWLIVHFWRTISDSNRCYCKHFTFSHYILTVPASLNCFRDMRELGHSLSYIIFTNKRLDWASCGGRWIWTTVWLFSTQLHYRLLKTPLVLSFKSIEIVFLVFSLLSLHFNFKQISNCHCGYVRHYWEIIYRFASLFMFNNLQQLHSPLLNCLLIYYFFQYFKERKWFDVRIGTHNSQWIIK